MLSTVLPCLCWVAGFGEISPGIGRTIKIMFRVEYSVGTRVIMLANSANYSLWIDPPYIFCAIF